MRCVTLKILSNYNYVIALCGALSSSAMQRKHYIRSMSQLLNSAMDNTYTMGVALNFIYGQ